MGFGRSVRLPRPGDPVRAADHNELLDAARRGRARPGGQSSSLGGPSGVAMAVDPEIRIWGRLSGASGPYSFVEVIGARGGGWHDRAGGWHGTANAYEQFNQTGLGGKVVALRQGYGAKDWRFAFRRRNTCTPTICVVLHDMADSSAIVGAAVSITNVTGAVTLASGVTDSDGSFCSPPLPENIPYKVNFTVVKSRETCNFTWSYPGARPCDVTHSYSVCVARATLHLTNHDTGDDVAGASVSMVLSRPPTCPLQAFSVTGSESDSSPGWVVDPITGTVDERDGTYHRSWCLAWEEPIPSTCHVPFSLVWQASLGGQPGPCDTEGAIPCCGIQPFSCSDIEFDGSMGQLDGFVVACCGHLCVPGPGSEDSSNVDYSINPILYATFHDPNAAGPLISAFGALDGVPIRLDYDPSNCNPSVLPPGQGMRWTSGCLNGPFGNFYCVTFGYYDLRHYASARLDYYPCGTSTQSGGVAVWTFFPGITCGTAMVPPCTGTITGGSGSLVFTGGPACHPTVVTLYDTQMLGITGMITE